MRRMPCKVYRGMFSNELVVEIGTQSYLVEVDKVDGFIDGQGEDGTVEVGYMTDQPGLWAKLPTIEYKKCIPITEFDLTPIGSEVTC